MSPEPKLTPLMSMPVRFYPKRRRLAISFGAESLEAADTICWPETGGCKGTYFWAKTQLAGDRGPFFGQDFRYLSPPMANPNEPKKETVRIELPPMPQSPSTKPPDPNAKSRETVRIQLPVRQLSDTAPLRAPTGPPPVSKPADQDLLSPNFSSHRRPRPFLLPNHRPFRCQSRLQPPPQSPPHQVCLLR